MTQVETSEPTSPGAAATDAASERLSAALQRAFPAWDDFARSKPEEVAPVDDALRAVVMPPVLVSSEELAEELRGQRLLFKRGPASVPIGALLAIGFSLGFHAVLVVVFWLCLFVAVRTVAKGSAGWAPEADSGGGGGYMIQGTGPEGEANLGGDVKDLLAKAGSSAAPAPSLPVPQTRDPLTDLARAELSSSPETDVIGVTRGAADLGTMRIRPPSAPALSVNNIIAPAPPVPAARTPDTDPTAVASAAGRTGPKPGARTPGSGLGGSDDNDPVVDIMKPGSGGSGNGHGTHAGDGLDRGASGANNESPQVLDSPPLDLPTAMRLSLPRHRAVFEVTVLTDGRPGKIELTESCGQKEIDDLCQATVAKYRFRPAYLAGRAIAKSMTVSFSFGDDQ